MPWAPLHDVTGVKLYFVEMLIINPITKSAGSACLNGLNGKTTYECKIA